MVFSFHQAQNDKGEKEKKEGENEDEDEDLEDQDTEEEPSDDDYNQVLSGQKFTLIPSSNVVAHKNPHWLCPLCTATLFKEGTNLSYDSVKLPATNTETTLN